MSRPIRILHLEDSARDAELVQARLDESGIEREIVRATCKLEFERALSQGSFDLILCDYNLPDYDGLSALEASKKLHPEIPVILLSGALGEDGGVECMKLGATDYLLKQRLGRLGAAVKRALRETEERVKRLEFEKALRESEERFANAFVHAPIGMALVKLTGQWFKVNPALCRLFGYSADELLTMKFQDLTHPDDLGANLHLLEQMLAGEISTYQMEKRYFHKDGHVVWTLLHVSLVRSPDGQPLHLIGQIQDITERKRTEDELKRHHDTLEETVKIRTVELEKRHERLAVEIAERKRTEAELRKLSRAVEKSPIMVIITDVRGIIEYVNPEFVKTTGYSEEEAVGKNPRILNSGTHTPEFYNDMWTTIHAGKTWHGEFLNKRKNGELYWQSASIASILDAQGIITHFVSVMEDVTERKHNAEELQNAKEAAESASRAKSAFLANMSHEIRTPMNGIIGLNYLMMQTQMTLKQKDYAAKIDSSARNLMRLINDILDFSKVEAGKVEIEKVEFGLDEVLYNLAQLTSFKATEKRLSFKVDLSPELPNRLVGDPLRLGQVLLNLASNAIKFTERGEVAVSVVPIVTTGSGITLRFSVSDTGIGLTPQQIKRIFEPFAQASSDTTRKYGGTGLGLAISTRLIELMGGNLEVRSVPNKGTTFSFSVRFDRPSIEHKGTMLIQNIVAGRRALVIDSNDESRVTMARTLRQLSFDVVTAKSGEDALGVIKRMAENAAQGFDLVMIDFKLPGLSCVDTMLRIRSDLHNAIQPSIILVFSPESDELPDTLGEAEFDASLSKPVSRSALFDAIMKSIMKTAKQEKTPESKKFDPAKTDEILHGSRILLVEDNEINTQVACEALKLAGCVVTVACNGVEAMNCLRDSVKGQDFDVVLMDLQMPEMDGYEATRLIRAGKKHDGLPILAMTADAVTTVEEQCMAAGMNDYLTKPVQFDELFKKLGSWVRSHRASPLKVVPLQRPRAHSSSAKHLAVPYTSPARLSGTTHAAVRLVDNTSHSTKEKSAPAAVNGMLDIEDGIARVAGNRSLYFRLLGQMNSKYNGVVGDVDTILARGEKETALRLLHSVKGVAANLGASPLAKAAAEWESCLKQEKAPEITAASHLHFQHTLAETLKAIDAISHTAGQSQTRPAIAGTQNAPLASEHDLIQQLAGALEKNAYEADPLARTLETALASAGINDELAKLRSAINSFNFPQARDVLKRIAAHCNVSL